MKVQEFQEKLTTVSDSKLRRMLAESREKGPEVAMTLLLAEAQRRGLDSETEAPPSAGPVRSGVPSEGFFPDPRSYSTSNQTPTPATLSDSMPPAELDGDAPAVKGAWLHEEVHQGMPILLKVLLGVVVLGGVAGGLFFFLNKGG